MNELPVPDFRLQKKEILRKRSDIQRCFNNGIYWQGKHLRIIYMKAKERKAGFIVAKRLGKSVLRNRVKRRLREIYRTHKYQLEGFHIIFSPQRAAAHSTLKDFRLDLERFLATIKETQ